MNNFKLEVFTDYVCPWCYLGDSRVKKLKQVYGKTKAVFKKALSKAEEKKLEKALAKQVA